MNRLFDILNAKLPLEGLRLTSDKLMFLQDCLVWLDRWEAHTTALGCTKFLSTSTSVGLRVTLTSTIQLSQDLLKYGYHYILTSKFSQDPLERFFGLIRYAAGCDDHPSATMFLYLYRLLSVYSLLRLPKRCSSVEVSGIAIQLKCSSRTATKRAQAVSTAAECLDALAAFSNDDSDTDPSEQPSDYTTKDNIVYYVAGFVVRHCRRVTNCSICLSAMSSSPSSDACTSLINIKLRGALCWPSNTLYEALRKLEAVVASYLQQDINPFVINQIIEDGLYAFLPVRALLCADHAGWLAAEIAIYYAVTRLHWHAKSLNKESLSRTATKSKRKAAKLC